MRKLVIKYYCKSDASRRNYRKRIYAICNKIGDFELSEPKLAGQARATKTNNWILDLQLAQLKRQIDRVMGDGEPRHGIVLDETENKIIVNIS